MTLQLIDFTSAQAPSEASFEDGPDFDLNLISRGADDSDGEIVVVSGGEGLGDIDARALRRKGKKNIENTLGPRRKRGGKKKRRFPILNDAGIDTSGLEDTVDNLGLNGALDDIQNTLGITSGEGPKKKKKRKKKGGRKKRGRKRPVLEVTTPLQFPDTVIDSINAVSDLIVANTDLALPQFSAEDASDSIIAVVDAAAPVAATEEDPCSRLVSAMNPTTIIWIRV